MNRGTIDRFASLILAVLVCLSLWSVIFVCVFGDAGPQNIYAVSFDYCKVVSEGGWFMVSAYYGYLPSMENYTVVVKISLPRGFSFLWGTPPSVELRPGDRTYWAVKAPEINRTYACYEIGVTGTIVNWPTTMSGEIWQLKNYTWIALPLPIIVLGLDESGYPEILKSQPPIFNITYLVAEPPSYPTSPWFIGYGASFPVATWIFSLTVDAFFFWLSFGILVWLVYLQWTNSPCIDGWAVATSILCFLIVFLFAPMPTVTLCWVQVPVTLPIFAAETIALVPYIRGMMKKEAGS